MSHGNHFYWKVCIAVAVLLSALTFTPLIMPMGEYRPMLWGMPRTLWASMLIYIVFAVLIYIGTRVYPGTDKDQEVNR